MVKHKRTILIIFTYKSDIFIVSGGIDNLIRL